MSVPYILPWHLLGAWSSTSLNNPSSSHPFTFSAGDRFQVFHMSSIASALATELPHPSSLSSLHSVDLGSLLSPCSDKAGICSQETPQVKSQGRERCLLLPPLLSCSAPLLLQTCGNACLLISSACDLRPCDLARGRWGATHPVDPLLRRGPAVLLGKQNVK